MGKSRLLASSAIVLAAAGCAWTPRPAATPDTVYVVEGETTRSETSVVSCAEGYRNSSGAGAGSGAAVGPLTDRNGTPVPAITDTKETAYGSGTVANWVSFKTGRTGDRTRLTVSATSVLFLAGGRGTINANRVDIPATHEARAKADALLVRCTGEE